METSRLSTGEMVAGASALLLFLFLFLDWFEGLGSAWETFDIVDILLALCALVVLALVVMRATGTKLDLPAPGPLLILAAGTIALVLILAFLLEGEERKIGLFLSLLASAGIVYGGSQAMREAPGAGTAGPGASRPGAGAGPAGPPAGPPPGAGPGGPGGPPPAV